MREPAKSEFPDIRLHNLGGTVDEPAFADSIMLSCRRSRVARHKSGKQAIAASATFQAGPARRTPLHAQLYVQVLLAIVAGGLIVANVVPPGAGMNIDPTTLETAAVNDYAKLAKDQTITSFLMGIIPQTVNGAFVDGNLLQVLFFASASALRWRWLPPCPAADPVAGIRRRRFLQTGRDLLASRQHSIAAQLDVQTATTRQGSTACTGLSVIITLVHIVIAGLALARFVAR